MNGRNAKKSRQEELRTKLKKILLSPKGQLELAAAAVKVAVVHLYLAVQTYMSHRSLTKVWRRFENLRHAVKELEEKVCIFEEGGGRLPGEILETLKKGQEALEKYKLEIPRFPAETEELWGQVFDI